MREQIVSQMIEMLKQAKEMDFSSMPTLKFIVSLRDKLVFTGFDKDVAEQIVSSMNVEISPGLISDEDIEVMAVLYCELLNKVHDGLKENDFAQPIPMLLKMAEKFSLTLG